MDRFRHDYVDQTVLNPLGLLAILVFGTAMLVLPRRYAIWPMIAMGCFIAPAQRIAVFTLNFDLLRVMIIFGSVRVLAWREWGGFTWRWMDVLLLAFAVVSSSVYVIQFQSMEAVKYKLGVMYDLLGMYFLFRLLVRDWGDVERVVIAFTVVSVPVALAFIVESATSHNVFSVFGGVPDLTVVRDGRLRCQGAYAHPILAGGYWASLLPLMGALWWRGGSQRRWGIVGMSCGLIVIVLCASSTPVSGVLFAIIGMCFLGARRRMRVVRWSVVAVLAALHLVMNAPVWHLVSRIDLAGGSTGWHRFNLIDQFINRVDEWWLIGVKSVEHWGVIGGDITNQYILEAVRGGVWALILFMMVIIAAYARIGQLWRSQQRDEANMILAWALGVSLFVHCMMFIAVNYFGQINMLWYLLLAMIASLPTQTIRARRVVPARQPKSEVFSGVRQCAT